MKQTFVNKQEASKKKARWKQNHKVDCFKKFTNHFANFFFSSFKKSSFYPKNTIKQSLSFRGMARYGWNNFCIISGSS